MNIIDQKQRDLALNTQTSFIVQAPAGSGKTELLTQRFLALLATVSAPEEIIALTFTKKAANEMRNRILSALELATTQDPPLESHALKTWDLAKKALTQDAKLQWSLLENPNRLRVQTIDSLCANFSTQLPILSRLGSSIEVVDDAEILYNQAVNEILSSLDTKHAWTPALEALMLHLDNNFYSVKDLLIDMLKNRDQWLPIVVQSRHEQLRSILETNLERVISDLIINLKRCLPPELKDSLFEFSNFSRSNLNLETWADFPDTKIEDWLYLAKMLLTQDGAWRKTVMKTQGFPAESDNKTEKLHYKMYKTRFIELLNELRETEKFEDFRTYLVAIFKIPDTAYSDQQWKILSALLDLLPITAAQLSIEFKKADQIDFIEQAQAALNALGDIDNPTDLTLLLDCKIHHLLIDEFQDTSVTQYRLIETLISGWEVNDGRTLFLVGDPMQSIYGFRAAEVGFFYRPSTLELAISNLKYYT